MLAESRARDLRPIMITIIIIIAMKNLTIINLINAFGIEKNISELILLNCLTLLTLYIALF